MSFAKYDVVEWKRLADQLVTAVESQRPLVVFMATYTENTPGAGDIIMHAEGHEDAMRAVANALYRTYGDGAYDVQTNTGEAESLPVSANLH